MRINLKILIILGTAGILIGLLPILETKSQEAESWAEVWVTEGWQPARLAMVEENSLLAISNPSDPEPQVARKIRVVVTAYSSTPAQTDDNPYITAAGTWVREGIIANNKYPFRTKVRFPEIYGDKIFVVEDRMHGRKGDYHFDIWMDSYEKAKGFGVKIVEAEILEN